VRFFYLEKQHAYDSYLIKGYLNEGYANGKAIISFLSGYAGKSVTPQRKSSTHEFPY